MIATYLQLPKQHQTIQFNTERSGSMTVVTKYTMDPDEDCDWQTMSKEEARTLWKAKRKEGFVPATGWHQDKRRMGD